MVISRDQRPSGRRLRTGADGNESPGVAGEDVGLPSLRTRGGRTKHRLTGGVRFRLDAFLLWGSRGHTHGGNSGAEEARGESAGRSGGAVSRLPRGYTELERRDRRMFRRLIDTAVFAGDHLKDAHDWIRESPVDEADDEPPAGIPPAPEIFIETGPPADPLAGSARRRASGLELARGVDPFVPAASAPDLAADPMTTIAMRVAVAAAMIAVAAAFVAAFF